MYVLKYVFVTDRSDRSNVIFRSTNTRRSSRNPLWETEIEIIFQIDGLTYITFFHLRKNGVQG